MRFLTLAASLIVASSTLAYAQAANKPTLVVGDTWIYTKRPPQLGEEARIVRVDENGYSVVRPNSTCPKCSWVYDNEFTLLKVLGEDGEPAEATRFGFLGIGMKFMDFPLEVKKTWRIEKHGLFRGNFVPYNIECTVAALEDVKTKAGTSRAFRIDRSWKVVSTGRAPAWSDRVWFSPDVKNLVKFESTLPNSEPWELASYSLKP
jgi:hypothetical protein